MSDQVTSIDKCYCACHSPYSSNADCTHCHGYNEVGIAHNVDVTMPAQELQRLLLQERIDECKRAANHNNSEYTSDYLDARITALQSALTKEEK